MRPLGHNLKYWLLLLKMITVTELKPLFVIRCHSVCLPISLSTLWYHKTVIKFGTISYFEDGESVHWVVRTVNRNRMILHAEAILSVPRRTLIDCFITALNIVTACAWHARLKGYLSYLKPFDAFSRGNVLHGPTLQHPATWFSVVDDVTVAQLWATIFSS